MRWGESESVSFRLGASEAETGRKRRWMGRGQSGGILRPRHWHKSPQHRRGSGSSQGRVGRAMGQPLPGLACWYLQMSSLKCWRSLLLLKHSPERLGSLLRGRGNTEGGPFGQTLQLHASMHHLRLHLHPPSPLSLSHTSTLQYTAGYSQSRSYSFLSSLIDK